MSDWDAIYGNIPGALAAASTIKATSSVIFRR